MADEEDDGQVAGIDAAVSEDGLLNGKVRLLQPKEG